MNESKVIEISKRLRAAPEEMRTGTIQELINEVFKDDGTKPAPKSQEASEILLVIDSIAGSKPDRAEIETMLGTVRGHLAKATEPEKIAVLHKCVCRLREMAR